MKILIGIATYLRPAGLQTALDAARRLNTPPGLELEIVVADNDPNGSAESVCMRSAVNFPWPLHYLQVDRRGVGFVRNRLAEFSLSRQAAFLAFFDDDETPEQNWLAELLRVQAAFLADIVGGPVQRTFPQGTPSWYRKLCFFEMRRVREGRTALNIDCGNMLIAASVFHSHRLFFDDSFAVTGGEDAMFSLQARRQGLVIAWAAGALVYEAVPGNRLRPNWLVTRSFRVGTVTAMLDRRSHGRGAAIPLLLAKAGAYLFAGLLSGIAGFGISPHQNRRSLIFLSRSAGLVCGLFGATRPM